MAKHGMSSGPDHRSVGYSAKTDPEIADGSGILDNPRNCSIYAITHSDSGKQYIGSSVNYRDRWRKHKYELRHNKHHCQYLQNAWNKYGEAAFIFSVIETLNTNEPLIRRKAEIAHISKAIVYNSFIAGEGLDNFQASNQTRMSMTKAIRERLSEPEIAEWYKKRGEALAEAIRTPEGRLRASQATKKRWKDPEQRKVLSSGLIKRWKNPNSRKIQSEKLKAARGTPEARLANSIATKARWADPNSKLHTRIDTRWNDPLAKERQAAKMRAYHAARRDAVLD